MLLGSTSVVFRRRRRKDK
ncbi:hypothetical protein [Paenibacillus tritici]